MALTALNRSANSPAIASLWALTVLALIPFPTLPFVLLGAAANLAANVLALYLLCSRSRVDRLHGSIRLVLQVVILALGAIAIARSGISVAGFYHYLTHRSP